MRGTLTARDDCEPLADTGNLSPVFVVRLLRGFVVVVVVRGSGGGGLEVLHSLLLWHLLVPMAL